MSKKTGEKAGVAEGEAEKQAGPGKGALRGRGVRVRAEAERVKRRSEREGEGGGGGDGREERELSTRESGAFGFWMKDEDISPNPWCTGLAVVAARRRAKPV